MGIFSAKAFGDDAEIGYYNESLVYIDMNGRGHTTTRYGRQIMEVRRDSFLKWTERLHKEGVDMDTIEYDAWIVSAPLCAMQHTNGACYLLEDGTTEGDHV